MFFKTYFLFNKDQVLKEYGFSSSKDEQASLTSEENETKHESLVYVSVYFKTLNERSVETVAVYDVIFSSSE